MANPSLLDIDMAAVDFAAAHAELLTLKIDNPRTRPGADSRLRAIAEWANYVDDCGLAFQSRLREHATAIADLEDAVATLDDEVLVDIDATAEATLDWQAAGDGSRSFGGVSWSVVNTAAANTLGLVTSTGLRFNASTTNGAYTSSSRTAAYLRIPVTTLIPAFDPLGTYVVEAYFSSLTLGTSGNRILLGIDLDVGGTDRLLGGGRRNTSGTQQLYVQNDATINGDASSLATVAAKFSANFVASFGGTYSAGFPARYTKSGGVAVATDSYCGVMDDAAYFVIAFVSGETGGAMDATLARYRVRRIRG